MQQYQKHLGSRLKDLRKKKDLTQAELAQRLGVNQSYIAKIEGLKEEKQPTIEFLLTVCKFFNVGIDDLIGTKNETDKDKSTDDLFAGLSTEDKALALAIISRLRQGVDMMESDWRQLSQSVAANGGSDMASSFEKDIDVFLEPTSK